MKRFQYNKLCRDKTLDRLKAQNCIPKYKILSGKEYFWELKLKLREESEEVIEAQTKDELIKELADVKEVYEAILSETDTSENSIERYRQEKTVERGTFKSFIYSEYEISSQEEYLERIFDMLVEKSEDVIEVESNKFSKDILIEELAEVKEIYEAILSENNVSENSIEKYRQEKIAERGAFKSRIYIEYADMPPSAAMYGYCLKWKDKYPELPIDK
ncbi:hypothetical protein JW872_03870 [Candidatus Babeliales bacterium]|nr:hypothetical protein [Candidatus Babeliales bacterium]